MALNENNQITMDNLDELEVHLTIVAKNPQSVKSTSAFLGRRDWPTKVISNANEAIESIAKDKPDIVLLSFNHPQLNVEKFASLLSQTLNMTCVGFCEAEDRASTAKLHSSKLRYKLIGAPSGPTVHRFVRKVLIEKYGLNIAEADPSKVSRESSGDKEEDGDIVIAGKSGKGYGKTSVVKGEQLETGAIDTGANESEPMTDGIAIQEGIVSQGKTFAAEGPESITYGNSIQNENPSEDEGAVDEGLNNLSMFEMSDEERRRTPVNARIINRKTSSKEYEVTEEAEEFDRKKDPTKGVLKKKRLSTVTKAKVLNGQRSQTKDNLEPKEEVLHASMSEMLQSIEPNTELGSHPDEPVEWIGILPVVTKDSQGYLAIPVQTQPNEVSEHVLQKLKKLVVADFNKKGLEPKIEDGFFIQIDPTYFSSLAKGHAQFVVQQGINDEAELCVSYFSSTSASQPIKKVNKTMSTIRVDGVSTENPITFKVYLHLNKNKKYFLYLNTGRTLSGKQKMKLHDRGISSFFIKNTEVDNFKKYLAISFVKQLIVSLKEELTADQQGQEKDKKEESA